MYHSTDVKPSCYHKVCSTVIQAPEIARLLQAPTWNEILPSLFCGTMLNTAGNVNSHFDYSEPHLYPLQHYMPVKLVNLPVPEGVDPVVVVGGDISALSGPTYAAFIVRLMYAAILAFSVLTSFICGHQWWLMGVWYLWGLVAFYLWHYQAHHKIAWIPFNDQCYRAHKAHHWEIYPPEHFFGRPGYKVVEDGWFGYFNPVQWVSAHEMLLYILMFVPVVLVKLFTSMSYMTMASVIIGYLLMGLVGNYLHHAFHIKDVWLIKYDWFKELRAFHFVHHQGDARSNFAVLNMSLDRWLHSLSLGYEPKDELVVQVDEIKKH